MLARTLHARIYVDASARALVAGGKIDFARLAKTLGGITAVKPLEKALPLPDLGLVTSDGELTLPTIHRIGRALHRWRLDLEAEAKCRPAKRRRRSAIEQELSEIHRLDRRLQSLREYQSQIRSGAPPASAPFFLDPEAEQEFLAALNPKNAAPLPDLLRWYARIVYWLSGARALQRFRAAMAILIASYPEKSIFGRIREFQYAVESIRARAGIDSLRGLIRELKYGIHKLPSYLVQQGHFSGRLKGKSLIEHCDRQIKSCTELLQDAQAQKCNKLPGAIAALVAADGVSENLSIRPLEEAAKQENFPRLMRIVHQWGELIGKEGYAALLIAIDKLKQIPNEYEFALYQKFLASGRSPADLIWAADLGCVTLLLGSKVTAFDIRFLWDGFHARGCLMQPSDLQSIVEVLTKSGDLGPIRAWLRWLGSVSPRLVGLLWQKTLRAAFWENYLPAAECREFAAYLSPVMRSASRGAEGDARRLLPQIEFLQTYLGKNERLPKSLRRILEHCERREEEQSALKARKECGIITPAASARLDWLISQQCQEVRDTKLLRTAEEAFIMLGVEAQSHALLRLFKTKCRDALGDLANRLELPLLREFATWVGKMSEEERVRLKRLTDAHQKCGASYKQHLADNQTWMDRAERRGIKLDGWFAPPPGVFPIPQETLSIAPGDDLYDLFMMGEYFQTCLSLDGVNAKAVLTNAYDANKQVLFVTTLDKSGARQVIARKLLAINSDFKLIGYTTYFRGGSRTETKYQEIEQAMSTYCGKLAAQCNLELASEGAPEPIGDHFWYDDGVCEWQAEAKKARSEYLTQQAASPTMRTTPLVLTLPSGVMAMAR